MEETLEQKVDRHRYQYESVTRHALINGWIPGMYEYIDVLRARLAEVERERDEALANYQFMVDRAANEKLDGYRELGAKAAKAENERDALLAENRLLRATMEHCAKHAGDPHCCEDCPAVEHGPVGGCKVQDDDWDTSPLTAAEVARVARLEAVAEAAKDILWVFDCTCIEAYTGRGLHEPNAICGYDEDLRAALAALDGAE